MINRHYKKGFTLIELLVVIVIIAILSTIIIVSYTGAQRKARDGKRRTDVQTIASAYQIHYQETKTWNFSNAELQRVVPGTPAIHEGSNTSGSGWYNYENATSYLVSMDKALVGLGYLSNPVRDPGITSDGLYSVGDYRQYMKYSSVAGGLSVYAKLEIPNDEEIAMARTGNYGAIAVDTYGMTYMAQVK